MNQSGNPNVSVIIPTYNRAGLLPRAVNSVLAQSYDDYEIIIVDDCSSDSTQEIVDRFADSRIRSFRHERNRGQAAARNTGIAHALGQYVAFLDDDDEWLPVKLEKQVALLDASSPNVALVYGWSNWIDDSSGRVMAGQRRAIQGYIFDEALAMNGPSSPPTWLVRSSAIREVGGFDETMFTHEDRVLLCRIGQRYSVAVLPRVVVHVHTSHGYSQTTNRTAENLLNKATSTRRYIHIFANELDERPSVFSRVLRRLSVDEMMCAHPRASLRAYAASVRLDSLSLRHSLILIKVFLWYATPLSHFRTRVKAMLGRWKPTE